MIWSPRIFRPLGALALAAAAIVPGCATEGGRPRSAEPVEPVRTAPFPQSYPLAEPSRAAGEPLSLLDAQTLAAQRNPELAGLGWAVGAQAERVGQAAAPPNPTLLVEVEDLGGTPGVPIQATFSVQQRFEIGGKRGRRVEIAESEVDVAEMEHALGYRALTSRVTESFVEVLTDQERVALFEELLVRTQAGIERLEDERRQTPAREIDLARARIELSRTRLDLNRARAALSAARVRLAAELGGEVGLGALEGDLEHLVPPPELEDLLAAADAAPDVTLRTKELARRRATLQMERAQRIPDVTLLAGYRYISRIDDSTAVLSVELPIPLFDRNRGNVAAARNEVSQARAEREAARLDLRAKLSIAHPALVQAYQSALELRESMVPSSQQAFEDTAAAFERGQVSFVAVIEARRTAYVLRAELLSALGEYHQKAAEIEKLVNLDVAPDL